MASKVRVYGKAQNRTALGIVNAYLVMHPHATIGDLNKAFPAELNKPALSAGNLNKLFLSTTERNKLREGKSFKLTFDDDPLILQNGQKVYFVQLWQKPEFEAIVNFAKQYDIEVADFKPREGFKKGGYRLEYLNGYVPPEPKKRKLWWLWLLLILLLLLIIWLLFLRKPKTVVEERVVERVIVDTVYVQQLAEIEKDFNAAEFIQGSAELSESAKFVLHDLAKLLERNKDLKVKIVGHTSAEGDPAFNQKLSEDRAKAAVDFLVKERGISINRLEYEGKGSSEPLDPTRLDVNRRTEFIVIE
jgi:outer membrane protein OmpA-like peptidoglycan-associated protein